METRRRRTTLGPGSRPCDVCGSEDVALTESRRVRKGLHRVNPVFHAQARRYELCAGCGSKREFG